jgi:hypothetical protein
MATDAKLVGQASVTKTATFNSTGVDFSTRTPYFGTMLWMRVIYSAASTSAGAGAVTFRVTESSDNATFTGIYQPTEASLVLSTTAIAGEMFIPIVMSTSYRYARLELSAISGTSATVTYQADVVEARP